MQNIIERHFKQHFQKDNVNSIDKFVTEPRKLIKEISKEEVRAAISKMANNKAPGKDNINVELIKYAPDDIHEEIADALNNIFRTNNDQMKINQRLSQSQNAYWKYRSTTDAVWAHRWMAAKAQEEDVGRMESLVDLATVPKCLLR